MKKTYSDLLKDPRWQKKRIGILQRDNFKCKACESDDKTLHVHHVKYDEDLLPWEFDDYDLVTLCEDCHKTWHFTFGNKNLDPCSVLFVAKLYDKLEGESIERFMERYNKKH